MPDASGRIPPVAFSGRAGSTLERILARAAGGGADEDSPLETVQPSGDWIEDQAEAIAADDR